MTSASKNILTLAAAIQFAAAPCAGASGIEIFFDRAEWEAAAGAFTTVDCTGFPLGTLITDQYADRGVLFTEGNDTILLHKGFENDGAGHDGNGTISLSFAMSLFSIAVDVPGDIRFQLFDGETLIFRSLAYSGDGEPLFVGLVSTHRFDGAILSCPGDAFFMDDVHFAPPCSGDIDGSGDVGVSDLLRILSAWGECPPKGECREDLDGNGVVEFADLLIVLAAWGPCE